MRTGLWWQGCGGRAVVAGLMQRDGVLSEVVCGRVDARRCWQQQLWSLREMVRGLHDGACMTGPA
jgi:hypothetical protein